MRHAAILKLGCVSALSFFIGGCTGSAKAPNSQTIPPTQVQKVLTPADRYQLQPVRYANVQTMALLDTETGYVWLLSRITDAKPGEEDEVFAPLTVVPQAARRAPSQSSEVYRPCPPNDPLDLFTVSACNPAPPKEGDSK